MSPLLVLVLSIAAIALIVLALAWAIAGQMLARRKPDPPQTPADLGLPFEAVTFPTSDQIRLAGRLTVPGADAPLIVFCAGMFGSMDGDTPLVQPLVAAGFAVFQFDWRGRGLSGGERTGLSVDEALDLQGALDYLESRGTRQIGLIGFSMGGAVALRQAAIDDRVRCLICDGGFVDITHTFQGYIRQRTQLPVMPLLWLALRMAELRMSKSLREASPLTQVAKISPRPVFFIHGAADPVVPLADQDAIYAACGEPKSLWRVKGAGHREIYEKMPEEYVRRVVEFFRGNLW